MYRDQGLGFGAYSSGSRVQDSGFRVPGLRFKDWGKMLRFRVYCSGFGD